MRAKINIIVFLLALAAMFAIGIVVSPDEESVLQENRTPAKMPQLTAETVFGGSFSRDFENYLADSVGFRSFFTKQSAAFTNAKGLNLGLGKVVEVNKDLGTGATGEKKKLLVQQDKIEEVFEFDAKTAQQYAEMVNSYAKKLPQDIRLFNMLIPTQIEFETPLYQSVADNQKKAISVIYDALNPRVKTVDAYGMLSEHTDEYIYFRTDHHWTQLGAYYAYQAFCDAAGKTALPLSAYTKQEYPGFFGTLYAQAEKPDVPADTIEYFQQGENLKTKAFGYLENGNSVEYQGALYWEPAPGEEATYKVFLCGDHSLLDIPTNTKNGKTILIIKDSYANAFAPWLVENYEHIVLIDPRSYKEGLDAALKAYQPDDVLIMNYTLSTTFPDLIASIQKLYE